jgi:hypothetical protein
MSLRITHDRVCIFYRAHDVTAAMLVFQSNLNRSHNTEKTVSITLPLLIADS